MAYENNDNMMFDEFTYEVDCLLIGETGEPASEEQMRYITSAYEKGISPQDCVDALLPDNYELAA
jgi:hypothetical protein